MAVMRQSNTLHNWLSVYIVFVQIQIYIYREENATHVYIQLMEYTIMYCLCTMYSIERVHKQYIIVLLHQLNIYICAPTLHIVVRIRYYYTGACKPYYYHRCLPLSKILTNQPMIIVLNSTIISSAHLLLTTK